MESRLPAPFTVSLIRVPYDIELAIEQAASGKHAAAELYADELRTGVYRGVRIKVKKW
jgi:hypothetical protein